MTLDDIENIPNNLALQSVANSLAKLHTTTIDTSSTTLAKKNKNMLWSCCRVFLNQLHDNPNNKELYDYYARQLEIQQERLDALELPVVLGHGDFKPSNIILLPGEIGAKFVDWETCGYHYRAYDLAKLFRTTTTDNQSEARNLFLQYYCTYCNAHNNNTKNDTPKHLWLEAMLLLPMTWLEAAMFFHAKSLTEEEYLGLAQHRLKHYEESLSEWENNLLEYQQQNQS